MIPQTYLRSSSIKTWIDCPLRFFGEFCLGLRWPSGPAAIQGSIFHEVMETLANMRKAGRTEELMPGDEAVLGMAREYYDRTLEYIDVSRVPPSSRRKDDLKSKQAWIPFKKIKDSIENVFAMEPRSFDVRKMNVLATEQKFDIALKERWAKYDFEFRGKHYKGNLRLKGSIDLIIENDDGEIEIIDWKSGRSDDLNTGEPKTFESYADDLQLGLYSAVCQKYLGYDVSHVTIVFLNEGKAYSVQFDPDLVMDRVRHIYEEMKSCTRPFKNDTEFCMRYCNFCKKDFSEVKTLPLVKPRPYSWTNEAGITEERVYKMCGQMNCYFESGYLPIDVMNAIARKDFSIEAYVNT